MRPVHISIEGFSAYRNRVDVDFTDVDYFSLSGATGSGKSSLIDAMVFALYGRVPRLGAATVAPAISSGRDQATVVFDFMVGDDVYRVARDLYRTKSGGATVREARLERGEVSLESGAKNVTAAIEDVLRLSFEDFTRTVILPQGEFARFLTATPSERQQLLRGLLGLDVYGEVGTLARSRHSEANALAKQTQSQIDGMSLPSPEVMAAAGDRLVKLTAIAGTIENQEASLTEVEALVASLQSGLDSLLDARVRLGAIRSPDHIDELSDLLARATDLVDKLTAKSAHLAQERTALEERLSELPTAERIKRFETVQARLEDVDRELASSGDEIEADLRAAEEDVSTLILTLEAARQTLEASRVAHAAHDLATDLAVGDTCPVCDRTIDAPLDISAPADLEAARHEVSSLEKQLDSGRRRVSKLVEAQSTKQARLVSLATKRQELLSDLDADLSSDSIDDLKTRLVTTLDDITRVKAEVVATEAELKEVESELEERAEQQRTLGMKLMAQREAIADLKPDRADSDDPIVQWKELLAWRDRKLAQLEGAVEESTQLLDAARQGLEADRIAIERALSAVGIAIDARYSVAVARAEVEARNLVETHQKLQEEFRVLAEQVGAHEQQAAVARVLSQHLRSDGFERWLMVGAIAQLVGGANSLLAQLSDNAYSLEADDNGSFEVVDHRNADESRPIATLSGGETFLVSLALALSLAETLSAAGGTGLDAIILDEGFGTLDEELLEVVASVLEDLASRGLMVGIITHVKELAGLAPVRFRVTKGPEGASVEKVA